MGHAGASRKSHDDAPWETLSRIVSVDLADSVDSIEEDSVDSVEVDSVDSVGSVEVMMSWKERFQLKLCNSFGALGYH